MAQILRTILRPSQALAETAEQFSWDLPVNPLAAVIVTIRAQNNTTTATDYTAAAETLMSKISNINVRYRGATIIDGSATDLAVLEYILSKWAWKQGEVRDANGNIRTVTFALTFGRRPYDPDTCFPATRRGDLVMALTTADDPAGLNTFSLEIETVELLDATPKRFIKKTTSQVQMTSGDVNDISLPIGNKLSGLLLRPETYPTGASRDCSFREMRLKVDNVEVMYSRTEWDSLHGEMGRFFGDWVAYPGHVHRENTAGTYTQNALTTGDQVTSTLGQRYAYMDFDPTGDGTFIFDTRGAADVILHVRSDVTDTEGSVVMPVEVVDIEQTGTTS